MLDSDSRGKVELGGHPQLAVEMRIRRNQLNPLPNLLFGQSGLQNQLAVLLVTSSGRRLLCR